MTKEQLELDIIVLAGIRHETERSDRKGALDRTIEKLRADLAKLDGPAEGFKRIYLICDSFGSIMCWDSVERARSDAATYPGSVSIVVADVPLPRIVEIDGTVIE